MLQAVGSLAWVCEPDTRDSIIALVRGNGVVFSICGSNAKPLVHFSVFSEVIMWDHQHSQGTLHTKDIAKMIRASHAKG